MLLCCHLVQMVTQEGPFIALFQIMGQRLALYLQNLYQTFLSSVELVARPVCPSWFGLISDACEAT